MGRHASLQTLYDEVLQVSISKLREWGHLKPGHWKSNTITWSRNGNNTRSINITVNTLFSSPYLELDYSYNNEPRKYKVRLVSVPSNLGTGEVWYFLCPRTGKRCRILYMIGGWFLHREAFDGIYYDSQIQSKKVRGYIRVISPLFKADKLYEELYKPYFKRSYAGQPTKRYTRIKKQLELSERISVEYYERVLAGRF